MIILPVVYAKYDEEMKSYERIREVTTVLFWIIDRLGSNHEQGSLTIHKLA